MANTFQCTVSFQWDDEASVWIATSNDVEGLILEDPSFDSLERRVQQAIPELLELNHRPSNIIDYFIIARRSGRVKYGLI